MKENHMTETTDTSGTSGASASSGGTASAKEIGVIDRSAAILTALQDTPLTAAEVCRRLGYSKSTTYRLLADLRTHRFIVRDNNGLLRLGPFPGRRSIATTNSVLEHLRTLTSESVQLWVRVGEDRVCVRNVEADHELRVSRSVGTVLPLVDGGSGALALCGPGNPQEFYATKQARVKGTASASVAFTVGGAILALCVSYPLTREPDNVAGAYRTVLSQAAVELKALLDDSEELAVLRDIARLALGAKVREG
ncbi:transcriptional regulator [Brevibacterium aurantiacum]|uniref:Transcriptional regulator, IclR family n=2 Tax=Brevibacterium aurantiacum TaxID=273384 RepID=A0A1D7VYZ5_BREAU|nr:Transcriptional regulator, IclR family [Brevibacterium aurantiacum]AZL04369.1 transcriptional regulator [Brevibacterium aurantiacum]AZL11579.1 transcriptional regulator [Brevibacterium aurantiacum]RCS87534.1 transcriptional regulator [Brevibacterium aurantiacum]RCS96479.1 transcriptional regulator [Brevibacterium aurantiacum]